MHTFPWLEPCLDRHPSKQAQRLSDIELVDDGKWFELLDSCYRDHDGIFPCQSTQSSVGKAYRKLPQAAQSRHDMLQCSLCTNSQIVVADTDEALKPVQKSRSQWKGYISHFTAFDANRCIYVNSLWLLSLSLLHARLVTKQQAYVSHARAQAQANKESVFSRQFLLLYEHLSCRTIQQIRDLSDAVVHQITSCIKDDQIELCPVTSSTVPKHLPFSVIHKMSESFSAAMSATKEKRQGTSWQLPGDGLIRSSSSSALFSGSRVSELPMLISSSLLLFQSLHRLMSCQLSLLILVFHINHIVKTIDTNTKQNESIDALSGHKL